MKNVQKFEANNQEDLKQSLKIAKHEVKIILK